MAHLEQNKWEVEWSELVDLMPTKVPPVSVTIQRILGGK